MKINSLLLLPILILFFESQAQITITANDFKFPTQDSIRIIDAGPVVSYPDSGIAKIWDYTNLTNFQTVTHSIGPDIHTSTASDTFSNANVFIGRASSELFLKKDETKYELIGVNVTGGSTYVKPFSDGDILCVFPFTYDDSFKDSVASTYYVGNVLHREKSERHNKIIGYGQLLLPGKSYPDVLLSKSVLKGQTMRGAYTFEDELIEFSFYAPNHNYPVLTMYEFNRSLNGSVVNSTTSVQYTDAIVYVDIDEFPHNQIIGITVYPIPVVDIIMVKGLQTKSFYRLFDSQGKMVINGIISPNHPEIGMSSIPSGVYFLDLEGQISRVKLIKY